MRKRLTSTAHCAIKMRSTEADVHKGVKLLERDLINGPLHCFGHHDKFSHEFCTTARQKQTSTIQDTGHSTSSSDGFLDEESDSTHGKVPE